MKEVAYLLTDFGYVWFPPGFTEAHVRARRERIVRFAHKEWEAGKRDPYEWTRTVDEGSADA